MRRSLSLTAALLSSSAAFASPLGCDSQVDPQSRLTCLERLSDAVTQCSQQEDKLDRLLCFDALSTSESSPANPRADSGKPEGAFPNQPPAITAAPETDFGLERLAIKQTPDQLTGQVSAIQTDPYGKWTLTLENGQRWRQTESKRLRVKIGESVIIRKGALGSFSLSREGSNNSTRVKRIQ
ncbi:hypothetical protein [Ferrimonas gelatinilytica]|uniref:Type IV pilus biogenesis protein PilP n=1 Tax=Ferrimonas gelatinilytica TaxID=1255257 RepID=A0ABP9SGY7_9GAMM